MKSTGPRVFLILLALLAVGQVIWWGYTIINQQSLLSQILNTPEALKNYQSTKIMIYSEGTVFIVLWLLGVALAYRFYRRELSYKKAQNDFLSAITHELKTPITNIQLSLETLERPQIDSEQRHKYIERAMSATKLLSKQVERSLLMAQLEIVPSTAVDISLTDFIEKIVEPYKTQSENTVFNISHERNVSFLFPEDHLKVLIHSLLDNAVKYTSKHSTNPQIDILTSLDKENICIEISDNGVGIDPNENPEQMFQPFQRGKFAKEQAIPGTGLGLALARRVAKKTNTKIELKRNESSKGVKATLTLQGVSFG